MELLTLAAVAVAVDSLTMVAMVVQVSLSLLIQPHKYLKTSDEHSQS
jgi:hypothetical protein